MQEEKIAGMVFHANLALIEFSQKRQEFSLYAAAKKEYAEYRSDHASGQPRPFAH
jgi:hypothetical protein